MRRAGQPEDEPAGPNSIQQVLAERHPSQIQTGKWERGDYYRAEFRSPREGSWSARRRKRPDPAPARRAHPRRGRGGGGGGDEREGVAACRGSGEMGMERRGESQKIRRGGRRRELALRWWSGSYVTPSQHGPFLFLVFARVCSPLSPTTALVCPAGHVAILLFQPG